MVTVSNPTQQQTLEIAAAVARLEALGFTPLPIVPAQNAETWPKRDRLGQVVRDLDGNPKPLFNGKCPSYWDGATPRLIKNWAEAAEVDPSWGDWSKYQAIGVANNCPGKRWIDLDRKHFGSDAEFNDCVNRLKVHAIVSEFSPSGWHGLIQFEGDPLTGKSQMNISIDGVHVGEIPGFIVNAPSRRADGAKYVLDGVNMNAPAVANLESLGLSPSATDKPAAVVDAPAPSKPDLKLVHRGGDLVDLEKLISKKCKRILDKDTSQFESVSHALTAVARECYGWENLARDQGVLITSADDLISAAAESLGRLDKLDRCLKDVDRGGCRPGLEHTKGKPAAVNRLQRASGSQPAPAVEQSAPASQPAAAAEEEKPKFKKLNKLQLYHFLKENFDIQYDVWSQDLLVNGEECDAENFHMLLAVQHHINVGKDSVIDALNYIGQENQKDEVVEYLTSLKTAPALPRELFDRIANFCFGIAEDFDNLALKKILIAAVARAFNPGCKVDESPVLQGPQALGKSTFLRILAGDKFFNDNLDLTGGSDDEARAKLQTSWIHEMGEFDKVTNRREASEIKAFVTERVDNYRPKYARKPKKFRRRCIMFGTANPPQFLMDATGNRRYPIIKIRKRIDFKKIEQYRDQIWAAAVQAYFAGESWHYDEQETAMINQRAEEFAYEDPWDTAIMSYLENRDIATVSGILQYALDIEPSKQNTKETGRLVKILTRLGWTKGARKRLDGKLCYPWYPPATPLQLELESCDSAEYLADILGRHVQLEIEKVLPQLSDEQRDKLAALQRDLNEQKRAQSAVADDSDPITEALPDKEIQEWSENLANAIDSFDVDFYNIYRQLLESDRERIKFGMSLDYQAKLPQLKKAWELKRKRALAGV